MQETLDDGQDALRLARHAPPALRTLARAARALLEEGRVSTDGLLPSYRALAPLVEGHAHAGADVVDAAFLAHCRALGGDALLASPSLLVGPAAPRAPARVLPGAPAPWFVAAGEHACGDALALALGLSLEAAKLAHGLRALPEALRAAFATPADAQQALEALARGGAERDIDATAFLASASARVDQDRLTVLASDRSVYVVVGAGGRRVLDLLSPFARRLRAELAALGAGHGGQRADDVYAGIDTLCAKDDAIDEERHAHEAAHGLQALGAGASALQCELLSESDVDGRVRQAAASLKKGRALVVCVEERASSLAAVLAAVRASSDAVCRAVLVVVEASGTAVPSLVGELASGHVAALDNALAKAGDPATATLTLPSRTLRGTTTGIVDETVFPLLQAALRARVDGALPPPARLGVQTVCSGDVSALSLCCIDLLARLGPTRAAPLVRTGRGSWR